MTLRDSPDDRPARETAGDDAPACGRAQLRPVEPADAPGIHRLLQACLPDVPAGADLWLRRWHWQYWQNPFRRGRPAGWVLASGERIIGHIGAVYVPIRWGAQTVTGVIGADYAVEPAALVQGGAFAGLELAQALFEAAGDCVPMATTANEKTAAVFARYDCVPVEWTREMWRAPTTLAQQIRSCRGARGPLERRLLGGAHGRVLLALLTRLYRRLERVPSLPLPRGCWLETTLPQLSLRLGTFCDEAAETGPRPTDMPCGVPETGASGRPCWRIDRSPVYLEWRYARHPAREHIRTIVLRDDEYRPVGAAFLHHDPSDAAGRLFVEELLAARGRLDVVRTLLCAALRHAAVLGASWVVTTGGSQAMRHIFWELGFQERARSAPALLLGPHGTAEDGRPLVPTAAQVEFWHGAMF